MPLSDPAARVLDALTELERARRATITAASWVMPGRADVGFHVELAALCDRIADAATGGKPIRVACCAPPRHGKTELLGKALPITGALRAQALGRPFRVLYVTSGKDRARDVSTAVRRMAQRIYQTTGDPWWAPGEKWTATEWETAGGFQWVGTGWSSGTGGIGADLVIMDDLLGSGMAYRSKARRLALRKVVEEDLLSRLMGPCAAVHMETRRGTEDTTEWLLREYPGVWEAHTWKCYDEARGYLWPEAFGPLWRSMNPGLHDTSAVWRALYQQEPIPEGGSVVHPSWMEYSYPERPEVARVIADRVLIGVDLASTGKTRADHCAFVVVGCRGAFRDVLHVHRERLDYPAARRKLEELVAAWTPDGVVVEEASNGYALVADLRATVRGIYGAPTRGRDKVARLMPFLPSFAAGQVRMPANPEPWSGTFREEVTGFCGLDGEPDDQVDALVWALVGADGEPEPDHEALGDALEDLADADEDDGFGFASHLGRARRVPAWSRRRVPEQPRARHAGRLRRGLEHLVRQRTGLAGRGVQDLDDPRDRVVHGGGLRAAPGTVQDATQPHPHPPLCRSSTGYPRPCSTSTRKACSCSWAFIGEATRRTGSGCTPATR